MKKRQKKIPVRTCVGCRQSRPKRDLVRVVRGEEGQVFVDAEGKANGRGAYVCADKACVGPGLAKALGNALKVPVSDSVAQRIRDEVTCLADSSKMEE